MVVVVAVVVLVVVDVVMGADDGVATVVVNTGEAVGSNNNEDFIVGIRVGSCMDILGLCVGISLGLRLCDGSLDFCIITNDGLLDG